MIAGEHSNRGELGRLLQLILGCAVNCTEKQEYIQRIMAMEESVQHVVMTAIQEVMTMSHGRCFKISNTSCLLKRLRQTVQAQISLPLNFCNIGYLST